MNEVLENRRRYLLQYPECTEDLLNRIYPLPLPLSLPLPLPPTPPPKQQKGSTQSEQKIKKTHAIDSMRVNKASKPQENPPASSFPVNSWNQAYAVECQHGDEKSKPIPDVGSRGKYENNSNNFDEKRQQNGGPAMPLNGKHQDVADTSQQHFQDAKPQTNVDLTNSWNRAFANIFDGAQENIFKKVENHIEKKSTMKPAKNGSDLLPSSAGTVSFAPAKPAKPSQQSNTGMGGSAPTKPTKPAKLQTTTLLFEY